MVIRFVTFFAYHRLLVRWVDGILRGTVIPTGHGSGYVTPSVSIYAINKYQGTFIVLPR